jgi:hypothetical protein
LSSITHICSASNFGISGGEVPIVTPSMDPQRKKKKKKEIFIEFSKMKGFININQVHVSFQGNVLVQGFLFIS